MSTNPPATTASFGPLKQVDAGVLAVGYAEAGPPGGPAVVLLHGWPYDIHSYVEVMPLLAAAGYRALPYLRGFGTTRFLSARRSETANSRRSPSTPRVHGCSRDRAGDDRRLRLGGAGPPRRRAVARALHGPWSR